MPKVSVTIPTYNRSGLVKEAIESVLSQTIKDLELVVIDDGSIDDTRSVIESIHDSRVRYYYKDNGGLASARNMGIAKCTSEYIGFLDSDDLWPNDFLEVMLNRLESNPEYGCVYCPITVTYPDGRKQESHKVELCRSGRITYYLFRNSFIWLQTTLFRRKVLENLKFDESMRNHADTDALLRLSTQIRFLFVPNVQVIFRTGHGVCPRQDFSSINCNRIRVLERFYYRLGGSKFVPKSVARHKLSHLYCSVAKNYFRKQGRTAAVFLYRRAINYWPFDARLYVGLIRALLINKNKDKYPGWEMPKPLPEI
jgi:glycosyltransferase involved in cell wall biosynthesis